MLPLVVLFAAGCRMPHKAAEPRIEWVYTVRADDASFEQISQRVYGGPQYAGLIAQANPEISQRRLKVGMALVIPPRTGPHGELIPPALCDRRSVP